MKDALEAGPWLRGRDHHPKGIRKQMITTQDTAQRIENMLANIKLDLAAQDRNVEWLAEETGIDIRRLREQLGNPDKLTIDVQLACGDAIGWSWRDIAISDRGRDAFCRGRELNAMNDRYDAAIGANVRAAILATDLELNVVARECGITPAKLDEKLSGFSSFTVAELYRLGQVTGHRPSEFLPREDVADEARR